MSNQFATEQLLELLLTLKQTTPAAARQILNDRPPIAYALITLMVSMNAINFNVFQKTLSDYGAATAAAAGPPPLSAAAPVPTFSAIPPHLQVSSQPNSRTNTPPMQPQPQPPPYNMNLPPPAAYGYPPARGPPMAPHNNGTPPVGYGTPPPRPGPGPGAAALTEALARFPEDQRQTIMSVLAMPQDQIDRMPPAERAGIMQLRASLGLM
ncbi:hypothetical protein R3P38DRAFT_2852410 [Favolaschia claudopus]|uniref:Cleavage stimulation factor subunit 2 hinge domain-containing protein n=1 Tax=Favolaschia claudopus TaxID=2862362 RepID=A0AAW0DQJ4_9AGAR